MEAPLNDSEPAGSITLAGTGRLPLLPIDETVKTVLTVGRWADLALGIDESWMVFAVPSIPDQGSRFQKAHARPLNLRGKRWKVLLNLAARSPDGRTVSVPDALQEFGYLPPPAAASPYRGRNGQRIRTGGAAREDGLRGWEDYRSPASSAL